MIYQLDIYIYRHICYNVSYGVFRFWPRSLVTLTVFFRHGVAGGSGDFLGSVVMNLKIRPITRA